MSRSRLEKCVYFIFLYALPVCRDRAWTCVLCLLVSSGTEISGGEGHKATGTPTGSKPEPSAPHILGGLGLHWPDMRRSEVHIQTHVESILKQTNPTALLI